MIKKETKPKSKIVAVLVFTLGMGLILAQPALGSDDSLPNGGELEGNLEIRVNLKEAPAPELFSLIKGKGSADVFAQNNLDATLDAEGFVMQTGMEENTFDEGETTVRNSYGENEVRMTYNPGNVDRIENGNMEYTSELGNRVTITGDAQKNGVQYEGGAEGSHNVRVNLDTGFSNTGTTAGTNSRGSTTAVSSGGQYFSAQTQSQATPLQGENLGPDAYSASNNGQAQAWIEGSKGGDSFNGEGISAYSNIPFGQQGTAFSETSGGMSSGPGFINFNVQVRTTGSINSIE